MPVPAGALYAARLSFFNYNSKTEPRTKFWRAKSRLKICSRTFQGSQVVLNHPVYIPNRCTYTYVYKNYIYSLTYPTEEDSIAGNIFVFQTDAYPFAKKGCLRSSNCSKNPQARGDARCALYKQKRSSSLRPVLYGRIPKVHIGIHQTTPFG